MGAASQCSKCGRWIEPLCSHCNDTIAKLEEENKQLAYDLEYAKDTLDKMRVADVMRAEQEVERDRAGENS